MKGKAVKLLEVMLEETNLQSADIRRSLQGSVNSHSLAQSMKHFNKMTANPVVRKKEKDDEVERGKFQCYHALIGLTDSKSIGIYTLGLLIY